MIHGSTSRFAAPRLHFVVAVWGEAFTRRFVNHVLSTHASPGNLGTPGDQPGDIYRIYTTPEDAEVIRASPAFAKVAQLVDVRIEDAERWLRQGLDKYAVAAAAHRAALDEAHRAGAAVVILGPDGVFADGAFARLRELTCRGIRRVLVAGIRAEAGLWIDAVRATHPPDLAAGSWTVPPRAAIAATLRHPHPQAAALRWDALKLHAAPSHLYFADYAQRVGDVPRSPGWLCRAFHLHPLLVWPRELRGELTNTVDGDLDRVAPLPPSEVHIVTDSDEIAAVELSDAEAVPIEATIPREGRTTTVAEWAESHTDAAHRRYFDTPIRLTVRDADDAAWSAVELEAERVATDILGRLPEPEAGATPPETQTVRASVTPTAKLHFIVPVWGKTYIERFLRWGLLGHLAPGNLPAVADRTFRYDIVTDRADLPHFEHPAMDRLKQLVPVRFRTPGEQLHRQGLPDDVLGYTKMTRYYNAAITDPGHAADPGLAESLAHVFLTPEGIFSDGMFARLLERLDAGQRAVAIAGFRVAEEPAIDAILEQHRAPDGLSLSATPRQLAGWVLDHPHPITRGHVWGQPWDGPLPNGKPGPRLHSHYYWPVDPERRAGFLAHCFHVHPMVVWPITPGFRIPPGQTLDHEYLQQAVPNHLVHYVTDTDEMCGIDIAHEDHLVEYATDRPYVADDVAAFAGPWTNGLHRWFFSQGVRVHRDDLDEAWTPVESAASIVVGEVLRRLSDTVPMAVYAESRTAQALQAELARRQANRPGWMRAGLALHDRRAALRQRAKRVGWWKVFAVRTRTRRAARRVVERLTLDPADRGTGTAKHAS